MMLTNSHVVERCQQIRLHSGAQDGTARVIARDDKNDLALLATDLQSANVAKWRVSIRQGEDVVVYGFPLAGVLAASGNVAAGNVTALAGLGNDARFLQISAPVQPGNSGGPLLDRSGNVVGIVDATLDALKIVLAIGDIPQNVNFAIKASVAAAFLDAHGVAHPEGAATPPVSIPDIAERARAMTMQVMCVHPVTSALAASAASKAAPGRFSAEDRENRFVEIERQDEIVTYDLATVQMIQPGRFSVIETTIDPPDVMKFQLKVLETLRTFCRAPAGKYSIPPEVFTLGPPDMPVENVEVRSQDDFKMASWRLPYRRLSLISDGVPTEGFSFLHCKQWDQTEEQLYQDQRGMITNGLRTRYLFDCKRGLWGMFLHENDDPAKVITGFVRHGSRMEREYFQVCYRVMGEVPHLPD
jgi:hypothetical protein